MSNTATSYPHIVLDASGTALIEGTPLKVIELVAERLAYGWSPEELAFQHPALSLGQIYAALAYYWDNRAALDTEIDERLTRVEAMRQASQDSALAQRLRALRARDGG